MLLICAALALTTGNPCCHYVNFWQQGSLLKLSSLGHLHPKRRWQANIWPGNEDGQKPIA